MGLGRACCLGRALLVGVVAVVVEGVVGRWLFESAACEVTFPGIQFRAVFHRSEPGRVAREIVVVSVGSVSSSHLWASLRCFRYPFCLIDTCGSTT